MTRQSSRRLGPGWIASISVTGLVGVLMLVGAVLPGVTPVSRAFLLVFGAFLVFVVVRWVQLYVRPRALDDAVVATTVGGEPALVMRMRPDIPVNALVGTGVVAAGFWASGTWFLLDRGGNPVVPYVLALLFTWFVPDAVRTARQGGGVVVTPTTVEVQAWDAVSRLRWDDVVTVEPEQNGSRAVLRLTAGPAATSWTTSRRWWLKRYDPRPPERSAEIFVLAMAVDRLALSAALFLWHRDPSSRADIGSPQSAVDLMVAGHIDPRGQ